MKKPTRPARRAHATPRAKEALQGWKATALATAVAAALCWPVHDAQALALGRITVQSALGEPLRAEIDLPDISAEEAASLQTSIAGPDAFRAAGLEYNASLDGIRIVQHRRPDGRTVLRLSSDRAVNDPFVDIILRVSWATGRIVRDYTILLDPPPQRTAPPVQATAPQLSQPAVPPPPSPVPPAVVARPSPPPPPAAPPPVAAARPRPVQATPPAPVEAGQGGKLTVRPGDTASRIAMANKPPSVSLDQMLVAMLRSNPDAFMQGNVNRLKAGAVLGLPTTDQAAAVPTAEASQTILAQSRDFNAFRGRLASAVPSVPSGTPDRAASGRVQAQVDERRPTATAPDKLTLSKGGVQGSTAEERIAREKAASDSAERVAELSRNINELSQLGAASGAAPATPAPGASAPPAPAVAAAPGPAAAPAAPTVPAAPAKPPAPAAAAAAPAADGGWMDDLLANPLLPGAAAALVALLAAFGVYRVRQRKKAEAENAYLESRQQPDSFFGASGGQRVDTTEEDEAASTMSYSPSQLDAASDVDPVAEADVYLAYGRDLQAEEILKEALRVTPTRVAIHAKLAEIYAKRRDGNAFQSMARDVHGLTGGTGPEWTRVVELGRELDPTHPLWSDGQAVAPAPTSVVPAAAAGLAAGAALGHLSVPEPPPSASAPLSSPTELDFDIEPPAAAAPSALDLDLDLDLNSGVAPLPHQENAAPLPDMPQLPEIDLSLPMDSEPVHLSSEPQAPALQAAAPPEASGLDFDFDLDPEPAAPAPAPAVARAALAPAPQEDSGLMGFDLGSLTLDLGDSTSAADATAPSAETAPVEDPLATKLALAEEFNAIGDADGARALAEEVLAEASGPLKARAERFLAELA